MVSAEQLRLDEADTGGVPWRRWGPYLSERQWGTVREDYGSGDNTWSYFSHEHARSRACRWGEDGLAGVSDDRQRLCLALGLWNGRDPVLKERLFGLTNAEGNHGEDVKECYFYLDATPTSSYLKMLYKYPQAEFPYADLSRSTRRGGSQNPEYELLDTGIFDRYRVLEERPVGLTCRGLLLFYEYFHGDNGAGIGASHQTGWTGTVALLPLLFRGISAEALRIGGPGAIKRAAAGGERGRRDDGVAGPAGDL